MKEAFDIMLHCPDVQTVDDIHGVEETGITDLQITPWTQTVRADRGAGAIMRQQPPLAVKQDAIKRYSEEVIAKFNQAVRGVATQVVSGILA